MWFEGKSNIAAKKHLGIKTHDEMLILHLIHVSQCSKGYSDDGWCTNSKNRMARMLDIKRRTYMRYFERLVEEGLIEVGDLRRKRVTEKYTGLVPDFNTKKDSK